MSKSKKKIKIKHRKYNFYNKKKSKGKQALTIILMIVIVIALCILGYGLGKPIMDYLSGQTSQAESTTASTSDAAEPTVEASEPTEEAQDTVEAVPPQPEKPDSAYTIGISAMQDAATLNAALAEAKAKGYEKVLLTLKTDGGQFMYKTDNKWMSYAVANIAGTLTAKEIGDIVKAQGMTAYAAISTLKDPATGDYAVNMRYNTADGYGWLDAAPENGGKSWLSPFAADTLEYVSDITAELTAAGFEKVILCDVMYPMFKDVDYSYYLSNMPQLIDNSARATALWNVVAACDSAAKNNGAQVMLQIDSHDVFSADLMGTTAELLTGDNKYSNAEIAVNYTEQSGLADSDAKSFADRMKSEYGSLEYSVCIDEGVSDTSAKDIAKAFGEAGITVISE